MRPSSWSVRLSSVVVLSVALSVAVPFPGGQSQTGKKTQGKAKASDNVPPGPPMTLEAIVKMLKAAKQGIIDQPRILAFINKRGLDFTATPDNLGQLMNAGAGPELIDLVSALKPPVEATPPPPPPPPVTGTLTFICAPAECNVRIDGGPDKVTSNGRVSVGDLVYREYTVDFRKEGFVPQSKKVVVSGPSAPEIAVRLEVKPETKALWGERLYTSAIQALGGSNGLAEFKAMTATGGASSWNEQGSQSEWTIKTTFAGDALYELNNPATGVFSISCQDETCGPPKGKSVRGKKAAGPEAESLNTNLRQYNRYNVVAIMGRIRGGNHKLGAAAAPEPGKENHLMATSPDESYDITLDGAFLPVSVAYRSSDGLASAKITFADYQAFGAAAKYPRLTSIALPGEKQHGLRVKYDAVAQSAK